MADLLQLLREYTINKKNILESDAEIIFGDFAWPKTAKTNYVIWGSGKDGLPNDYYTLEAIYYLLKNVDLPHAQYIRQAATANVPGVRLPDRRDLLAYVNGDLATTNSIDRAAPVDISQRRQVTKRPATDMGGRLGDGSHEAGKLVGEPRGEETAAESLAEAKRARFDEEAMEIRKQRLAAKLNPPSSKAPLAVLMSDQAKESSLTQAFTPHRIQALRAKFRANKQQQIKTDVPDLAAGDLTTGQLGSAVGSGETGGALVGAREVSRPYLPSDMNMVRDIVARERQWRTRITILQSQGKDFHESVLQGILRAVKLKEEGLAHTVPPPGSKRLGTGPITPAPPGHRHHAAKPGGPPTAVHQQPQHYSRYDQEKFTGGQEADTAGFQIDTSRTYHGMMLTSAISGDKGSSKSSGNRKVADPRTQVPSQNIPTATPEYGRNFRSTSDARLPKGQKARPSRIPIIIIPAAPTSLITMYNAKDLLQDLRFISTEERKAGGYKRDNEVLIQREKLDGTTVPYRVVDQPLRLAPDDWERVVAVFVQGPAWQFKGWPIGSDPVNIFNIIKAFHLKYKNIPLDANVQKWNVHVLQLDDRRHLDKANFQQFWDMMDKYMVKHKPNLRF